MTPETKPTTLVAPYCRTSLGKYADMGFTLAESEADEILELQFKGALVDRFHQHSVSIKAIQTACREYLLSLNSGLDMVGA